MDKVYGIQYFEMDENGNERYSITEATVYRSLENAINEVTRRVGPKGEITIKGEDTYSIERRRDGSYTTYIIRVMYFED